MRSAIFSFTQESLRDEWKADAFHCLISNAAFSLGGRCWDGGFYSWARFPSSLPFEKPAMWTMLHFSQSNDLLCLQRTQEPLFCLPWPETINMYSPLIRFTTTTYFELHSKSINRKNYLLYRLRSFSNLFLSKIQFRLVGFSFLLELNNQ